ncbi:unnamed protein product [Linum trigynum]
MMATRYRCPFWALRRRKRRTGRLWLLTPVSRLAHELYTSAREGSLMFCFTLSVQNVSSMPRKALTSGE